jgi:hypothetical protein
LSVLSNEAFEDNKGVEVVNWSLTLMLLTSSPMSDLKEHFPAQKLVSNTPNYV